MDIIMVTYVALFAVITISMDSFEAATVSSSTMTSVQKPIFTSKCPPGTVPCASKEQCIKKTLMCDGQLDCKDGTDEGVICDRDMNVVWRSLYKKQSDSDRKNKSAICILQLVPASCECHEETMLFCNNKTLATVPTPLPWRTTNIDLSLNNITLMTSDHFKSMTELETLIINHSYLKSLGPGTFHYAVKLQRINFNYNLLTNFTTEIFSSLSVVTEIKLKGNLLKELKGGDFTNMSMLQLIDMSQNQIAVIQENAFGVLPTLQTLDLRKNFITEIQSHYFRNLGSLKMLFLSDNRISRVQPRSFLTLVQLDILHLFNNDIQKLEDRVFDGLQNLSVILLARNQISSIDGTSFRHLVNVKSIDLRSNQIKRLENDTFSYFDKFYLCLYASQARVCEPQGDGISSKQNLLGNLILRICVWVVALLACGGNLMVILGRFLMREDNQIHSFFIKNLSLADLLMGFYLLVIAVNDLKFRGDYILHDEVWRNSWKCSMCGFLSTLSTEMSVMTLSVITLDRYLSIMYPLSLRKRGLKVACITMSVTWLICAILAALPIMNIDYFGSTFYSDNAVCVPLHLHEPRAKGWEYSSFLFLGINFGSFVVIAYAYVAMFYAIHMSSLPLRTSRESQERSLIKRFSFIIITDFMCWIPIIIIKIMALGGVEISDDLYAWVVVFALPVNSALNPLLYTLTTNLFKKNLLSKFTIVFGTHSTQIQSSAKNTSEIRQVHSCEMNLLKRSHQSPSSSTTKTYVAAVSSGGHHNL